MSTLRGVLQDDRRRAERAKRLEKTVELLRQKRRKRFSSGGGQLSSPPIPYR